MTWRQAAAVGRQEQRAGVVRYQEAAGGRAPVPLHTGLCLGARPLPHMWRRCALAWEAEHCAAEVRAAEEETGQEGEIGRAHV